MILTSHSYFIGSVEVVSGNDHWHEALTLYRSPMCGTSWVRPLLGVANDPLLIHFFALYELSIITRYRPKLWREITEGDLTEYLALLQYYLAVVDRIVPERALEAITGSRVACVQPGSLFAPGAPTPRCGPARAGAVDRPRAWSHAYGVSTVCTRWFAVNSAASAGDRLVRELVSAGR